MSHVTKVCSMTMKTKLQINNLHLKKNVLEEI